MSILLPFVLIACNNKQNSEMLFRIQTPGDIRNAEKCLLTFE